MLFIPGMLKTSFRGSICLKQQKIGKTLTKLDFVVPFEKGQLGSSGIIPVQHAATNNPDGKDETLFWQITCRYSNGTSAGQTGDRAQDAEENKIRLWIISLHTCKGGSKSTYIQHAFDILLVKYKKFKLYYFSHCWIQWLKHMGICCKTITTFRLWNFPSFLIETVSIQQ